VRSVAATTATLGDDEIEGAVADQHGRFGDGFVAVAVRGRSPRRRRDLLARSAPYVRSANV
jgi:hypothetical protein